MEPNDENYYKRKEDKEWREKVDHEQVTLITGHQVLNARVDEIEETLTELDEVLRGDRQQKIGGILARMHDLENQLARLNAVIFVDSTGKKGLQHEVQILQSGERTMEYRWKFWTSIVVAVISLLGLLVTNWDKILGYLIHSKKSDPVEQMLNRAKRSKHRTTIIRYRYVAPSESDNDQEDLPQ